MHALHSFRASPLSRREGGKIFGSGSRAPIAISLLVKNPSASQSGKIHFYDIGDYFSREEKLASIKKFASVAGITRVEGWTDISPDQHGDWLAQRDDSFARHISVGDKSCGVARALFENYSRGVATGRDAWCYNASKLAITENLGGMIDFYNAELDRLKAAHPSLDKNARQNLVDSFADSDPANISWTRSLKSDLAKLRKASFDRYKIGLALYRPFTKQWMYFDRQLNDMVYQMPRLFPYPGARNLVICVPGKGGNKGFSALVADAVTDLNLAPGMGGYQCFPLNL